MKKAEKAEKIIKILDELFPKPPIPLVHHDPFTLLISVLLSAQTTDKKVNEVVPDLFKLADTPEQMAKLTEKKILSIIRQIGLAPTKAKNIKKLAEKLVNDHQGIVPQTFEELEALAGVGHKTASVVMAQGFGFPAFPVDTHIHRLAWRWGLSSGKDVVQTEKDLKAIFPEDRWNRLHLQIIYFGREYCPARSHDLSECPICTWAASAKVKKEEKEKAKPKKKK